MEKEQQESLGITGDRGCMNNRKIEFWKELVLVDGDHLQDIVPILIDNAPCFALFNNTRIEVYDKNTTAEHVIKGYHEAFE